MRRQEIENMQIDLKTFRTHYKNHRPYRILAEAMCSETLKPFVVYECLYKNELSEIWIRPKEMFDGWVEVEGVRQKRFKAYESLAEIPKEALSQIDASKNI